jgi:hypothetical protein
MQWYALKHIQIPYSGHFGTNSPWTKKLYILNWTEGLGFDPYPGENGWLDEKCGFKQHVWKWRSIINKVDMSSSKSLTLVDDDAALFITLIIQVVASLNPWPRNINENQPRVFPSKLFSSRKNIHNTIQNPSDLVLALLFWGSIRGEGYIYCNIRGNGMLQKMAGLWFLVFLLQISSMMRLLGFNILQRLGFGFVVACLHTYCIISLVWKASNIS